jgi:putative SOS response-associated peptidase YedK
MAENVDKKPVFREAFQRRRCIVPVDSFYEWKKLDAKSKQPYAIALADRSLIALAGLWDTWRSPVNETIRSFTIVTTRPNELCGQLHNRMPVILPPEAWPIWLAEEPANSDELKSLLIPYRGEMTCWSVSQRVGQRQEQRCQSD